MPASLLLGQGVDLPLKLGVRLDGAWLAGHLQCTQTLSSAEDETTMLLVGSSSSTPALQSY